MGEAYACLLRLEDCRRLYALCAKLCGHSRLLPERICRARQWRSELLHFGWAFTMQYGIGLVVGQWSPQDGHYPIAAYQSAFGLSLALQAAALMWFAIPWLRTFGKHVYFLFAPRPAERDSQVGLVTVPLNGAALEARERMEW